MWTVYHYIKMHYTNIEQIIIAYWGVENDEFEAHQVDKMLIVNVFLGTRN